METVNQLVSSILQASPPVVLALVLWSLGYLLHRSPVANWLIPLIVMPLGGLIYPWIAEPAKLNYEAKNPFIVHVVYGLAIGALPTWADQAVRQWWARKNESTGKTTFFEESGVGGGQESGVRSQESGRTPDS